MKALAPILLAASLTVGALAQDSTANRNKVPADLVQAKSFIDALIKIASRFQLPLAVEWIKSPNALKPIRLSASNNANEVLDGLVSTHPEYAWQLENGIVHVFPKSMVNDPRNPLNVVVDKVPDRPLTVFAADNLLFESVGRAVRWDAPKSFELPLPIEPEPQFRLTGANIPVRHFLDQVITVSKMKIWIATFPNSLPLTVKGYWETTPMYNQRAVKPEDQPFWIFLRWGDAPWKGLQGQEP